MASLKPRMTIFEIRQKKCKNITPEAASAANTMRALRDEYSDKIVKHKDKLSLKRSNMEELNNKVKSESYIPYQRPDDAAEKYLEVNSFQKEATDAILEMGNNPNKQNKGHKVYLDFGQKKQFVKLFFFTKIKIFIFTK